MSVEKGQDRVRREQSPDIKWIEDSLFTFSAFAQECYRESGRGVIALGLQQGHRGKSSAEFYPMLYVSSAEIPDWQWKNEEAILQMVNDYTPVQEFIMVLMNGDWEHVMRAALPSNEP